MTRILCATCAVAVLACGTKTTTDLQGSARIDALFSVPPTSVSCIRLVASGMMRSVPKDFTVTAGQSTLSLELHGIPTGTVMFSGNAYAEACGNVTTSTVPSWIADDVTVTVVPGTTANVPLNFHANGNATVAGNFVPDAFTVTTLATGPLVGPHAVAYDGIGTLYIADRSATPPFAGMTIRAVSVAGGTATVVAGSATGLGTGDGAGLSARFNLLGGITLSGGTLYIADGCAIRSMTTTAPITVSTVLANASCSGPGSVSDIAVQGGDLYVTDPVKFRVWKVTPGATPTVTTVAGDGTSGTTDAAPSSAQFLGPQAIVAGTAADSFFVADRGSLDGVDFFGLLRNVSSTAVTTLAGTDQMGTMMDGLRRNAFFPSARRMVSDGTSVFIGDQHAVRRYDIATGAVVTIAGALQPGTADGLGSAARFNGVTGIARNGSTKALYVADSGNHSIRVLTP